MTVLYFVLSVCVVIGLSLAEQTPNANDDLYMPIYQSGVRDQFDWNLLKSLSGEYKNVIVSPISLKIVLVLLYEAAGGNTEQEIQNTLRLSSNKTIVRQKFAEIIDSLQGDRKFGCEDSSRQPWAAQTTPYTLNLGTRIFLSKAIPPLQSFQSKACEKYQTKIESTDFNDTVGTANKINTWVSKLTLGKVSQVVSPDDVRDAVLFITNAIYFKGLWNHRFPKNQTHRGGFYVKPNQQINVEFMATTDDFYFIEAKELDAKIIRIPYKGNKYAMLLALPNSKAGLAQLINNLRPDSLRKYIDIMEKQEIDVVLPKFKFEFQARLSKVLKDLGIVTMFHEAASLAGLSRGDGASLVVSDIVQKAGIEIDEEGSTAFASTTVHITNKFGDAQHSFNVTHPFLFFIEDQTTQTILFAGKVENPLESEAPPLPTRFGDMDLPLQQSNNQAATAQPPMQQTQPHFPQTPQYMPNPPIQLSPTYNNDQDDALKKRFNFVDLELLREVSKGAQHNILISPSSIKATLAMILEGSYGICAEEIANALRLPTNMALSRNQLRSLLYEVKDSSVFSLVEFANGIFLSNRLSLVPEYKDNIEKIYKGSVNLIDFSQPSQAAYLINGWVNAATRGLIPSIVGAENLSAASTILILNAFYFKGTWKRSFDVKNTEIKCFHLANKQCMNVYMMQEMSELNYGSINELNAHALEIPYSDDKYAMLILVPKVQNNIQAMLRDLQHTQFNTIVDQLEKTEVMYEMPRFDINYSEDLVQSLQQLGIREIFTDKANLTGIVNNIHVRVDKILHKTRIMVDEKGTEAAAVTGAVVIPLMGSTIAKVNANHPFAFFIYRRDNRNILFEGIVNRPTEARGQQNYQPQYTRRL